MQRKSLSRTRERSSRSNQLQRQSTKAAATHPMVALQQSIGNRAVHRLIGSGYIQAKLQISEPGDQYEQEADRVANRVMRMRAPEVGPGAAISSRTQISRLDRKCSECEKEVQRQPVEEDEETLQGKRSAVQRQPLEEEDTPLEKQPGDEEDMLQGRTEAGGELQASPGLETQIGSLRGGGQPLPESVRTHFEPRFGHDFSGVRLHTGAEAAKVATSINAKAFTVGRDIAFGAGQYSPESSSGQRLLAHELTHVVQQGGAEGAVQRQHVADTGFRYTLPSTVTRSIVEIQGIVGTTPDGVYGENTRRAVEAYQTKLKALGLYTDTLDGKWGKNTEAAHVAFATTDTTERRGYNCTGFAIKDYGFHGLTATKAIYATMTKLADCSKPCSPFFHKFFIWDYDLRQVDNVTGVSSGTIRDFHTVGGQTDGSGNGPAQVMSKNGKRPVEGPKPPLDWKPVTALTTHPITGVPMPRFTTVRTGHVEECFCNDKLPGRP